MITKGIIKSIDLLGNTCTVHIPFFETAGNDPIIETATVSNTPGSYNGYKVGDVVYVAFEDGSMSTPVVIGKLYLGTEKEKADPRGVSNVEESTATKKATLPADSKLTAEIDSNVPNTTVPYSSLSSIANGLNTLNTNVGQMDRDYGNRFKQVISDIEGNKSTLEQTASRMVAKVSGSKYKKDENGNILYDADNNPIPDPTVTTESFGWELQKDKWIITSNDTEVLKVDSGGLTVKGNIVAEKGYLGKFIIGEEHFHKDIDDNGQEIINPNIIESGIYTENYIDCFTQTPGVSDNLEGELTGTAGVYIGTDGIKLGNGFSVDPEGNVIASSLKVSYTDSSGNSQTADNIDAAIAAMQNYSDTKLGEAFTVDGNTTLGDTWLSTTTVYAKNLSAGKIEVRDNTEAKNIVFYANAKEPDKVQIGKFVVDSNSISLPTRKADGSVDNKFGANNTVMICTGSDGEAKIGGSDPVKGWNFTAGTNFGVRTIPEGEANAGQSELYVSKGKIGGFTVDEKVLTSNSGNVGISSDTSTGALAFWAGGNTKDSAKFYVTNTGEFLAKSGTIGNCTINEKGELVVPAGNITDKLHADHIDVSSIKITNANISEKLEASNIKVEDIKIKNANIAEILTVDKIDVANIKITDANITDRLSASKINAAGLSVTSPGGKGVTLTNEGLIHIKGLKYADPKNRSGHYAIPIIRTESFSSYQATRNVWLCIIMKPITDPNVDIQTAYDHAVVEVTAIRECDLIQTN